jgi:hypothetical protein
MILNQNDMYVLNDVVTFIRDSERCLATIVGLPSKGGTGVIVEFQDDLLWLEKSDISEYMYKSRLC